MKTPRFKLQHIDIDFPTSRRKQSFLLTLDSGNDRTTSLLRKFF